MNTLTNCECSAPAFVSQKGVSIVNFYANWSFYSRIQKLILKKLEDEDKNLSFKVFNINYETNSDLIKKYEVHFFPTLLIVKDGKIVRQLNGLQDKASITDVIKRIH